jgi:arylsulfatase A-like enzyme
VKRSARHLVLAILAIAAWLGLPARASAQAGRRPDVVVIVTDDQRYDTLWAMPIVERELVARGAGLANAFVVNAICCPSRASILTGTYSHTNGVYRQTPPFGRFEWLRDGSTLATWLHEAGYRTGLVGKYIDGYQHAALTRYVPPGWDRWVAFVHAAYDDYKLTVDGEVQDHGASPGEYSTDVLAREAVDFIRSTPAEDPLFLYFAPEAPHAPATPAPEDATAFADLPPWRPASYDEADVADKPLWVRSLPRLTAARQAQVDAFRRDQYRSLLSVDRAVGSILAALEQAGRLSNTLIVYTSDNGIDWGEHRWTKKEAPYEEVIRVPMVVRWDDGGVVPSSNPADEALNIDIAPTIAEAAGLDAPVMDGRSLLPVLRGERPSWRRDFLVEHLEGTNPVPTYCAVRSARWAYVRYTDGEEELYDLEADPEQLVNLAGDPAAASALEAMRGRLEALCDPAPPGFGDRGLDPRIAAGIGVLLGLFVLTAARTSLAVTKSSR